MTSALPGPIWIRTIRWPGSIPGSAYVLRGDPAALKIARASDLPSILHLDTPVFSAEQCEEVYADPAPHAVAPFLLVRTMPAWHGHPKWTARGCRIYVVTGQQRVTH